MKAVLSHMVKMTVIDTSLNSYVASTSYFLRKLNALVYLVK